MNDELYNKGMQTRRSVLGDAHVDKAEANKTELDADFQEYITNNAWGAVWSRPGLTKRERSLIVIALLAALGHDEELAAGFLLSEGIVRDRDQIANISSSGDNRVDVISLQATSLLRRSNSDIQ